MYTSIFYPIISYQHMCLGKQTAASSILSAMKEKKTFDFAHLLQFLFIIFYFHFVIRLAYDPK